MVSGDWLIDWLSDLEPSDWLVDWLIDCFVVRSYREGIPGFVFLFLVDVHFRGLCQAHFWVYFRFGFPFHVFELFHFLRGKKFSRKKRVQHIPVWNSFLSGLGWDGTDRFDIPPCFQQGFLVLDLVVARYPCLHLISEPLQTHQIETWWINLNFSPKNPYICHLSVSDASKFQ